MARTINDGIVYSREDLERMAKNCAKLAIIEGMYIGKFHDQTVEWYPDGSLHVVTRHTPATPDEWRKKVAIS